MSPDIDIVVIGAGVVGLAIARSLTAAGREVMVLERHGDVGQETSSRSSEVIHAGLYYPRGSLKARLCVAGRERLYAFARENGVPHARTGKIVVAISEEELPHLAALAATARANGVPDVALLDAAGVRALEPEIACAGALLSPSTGIVDSHALMVALEGHVRSGRGSIVFNTDVEGIRVLENGAFALDMASAGERASLTAGRLVIAAGLDASRLGAMAAANSPYVPPRTRFARGHYYALAGAEPFHHLVYPLPRNDGTLGIHLTLDLAGRARFGPDIEWLDAPTTAFDDLGGARRRRFEREIRRYWPGLADGCLTPAYVGVRPKIHGPGEPPADFAIHAEREHGIPGVVALYGIESPGLTASLAIGDYVAALLA